MSLITGMNKNKALAIFASIIFILATLGITLPIIYREKIKLEMNSEISIFKNQDFEKKYNFPGNGTASNPYLIEDLIIYTTNSFAITIQDTTKYFIIRNCTISAKNCLNIFNVAFQTAKIVNNTFWSVYSSNYNYKLNNCISVQFSPGTLIQNNSCLVDYFETGGRTGINVFHSDYTKIINNLCLNLSFGISIENSDNLLVIGNNCTNGYLGINIISTSNTIIMSNICTKAEINEYGMHILLASYSFIYNNTCFSNLKGMRISGEFLIVEMNNVSFNYEEGIMCYLFNSTVRNNLFKANGIGMLLSGMNSSITENQFLENTYFGIDHTSQNLQNTIYHNNFINNNLLGYEGFTAQAIIREPHSYFYGMSSWYNSTINKGNFWSDLIWNEGVVYNIDGYGDITDPYPLENPY